MMGKKKMMKGGGKTKKMMAGGGKTKGGKAGGKMTLASVRAAAKKMGYKLVKTG